MREIKFRAVYHGDRVYSPFDLYETMTSDAEGPFSSEGLVFEQFTSLHDKNGKEIYEGDIVLAVDTKVVGFIEWHNGRLMWTDGACHWDLIDWKLEDKTNICNDLEVIGNIHNNSELLE